MPDIAFAAVVIKGAANPRLAFEAQVLPNPQCAQAHGRTSPPRQEGTRHTVPSRQDLATSVGKPHR